MKKKLPVFRSQVSRRLWVLLGFCLLVIAVGMAGCGNGDEGQATETTETSSITQPPTEIPSSAPSQTQSEAQPNPPDRTEEDLRTHYEALIAELRAELLQEREDRYISDFEYKQRLEELEKALEAWEKATVPNDTPTVAPPETSPQETTPPPEETEPPKKPADSVVFNYRLENSEVIITGYTGTAEIVSVPSVIDGHPVTAIDDYAFQNSSVVSVILPGTVTYVGWFAFYGCFSLELISLPASVTAIQYAAFDGCPRLTILCPADSYAARYAVSFGLRHEYV